MERRKRRSEPAPISWTPPMSRSERGCVHGTQEETEFHPRVQGRGCEVGPRRDEVVAPDSQVLGLWSTSARLFTRLELLRRVASLVPPPRTNIRRFHGIFAPGAQLRPLLVPQSRRGGCAGGLGGLVKEGANRSRLLPRT